MTSLRWFVITSTFLAVNIDFFVILLFLCQRFTTHQVLGGYLLGLLVLMLVTFLVGQVLLHIFPEWLLGVLGIVPIWAVLHDSDDDPHSISTHSPVITVFLTYLSVCAGCNLSLFLPGQPKLENFRYDLTLHCGVNDYSGLPNRCVWSSPSCTIHH